MISKKTLFALTLIAIDVIAKASASSADTQKQLVKEKRSKKPILLQDMTGTVEAVRAEGESIVVPVSLQEQQTSSEHNGMSKKFKELIVQKKYYEIDDLGDFMEPEEVLKQLCQVMATPEDYKGLSVYLKRRNMVPSFFVHGKMEIVKEVIAGIKDYDTEEYIKGGDLEVALDLALKEEQHDRTMNLLVARQERTAEKDEQRNQEGRETSFRIFMHWFVNDLAPWKDSESLKRFMTLKGEAFNNKHLTVYETVCQGLVACLKQKLDDPNGVKLMVDLVAQPALLTPVTFAKGFLFYVGNTVRSNFITYSWREAIQEGLKEKYPCGGRDLWKATMDKYQGEFPPDYSPSAKVLDAVLKKFKTKEELEQEWAEKNAIILFNKLMSLDITQVLLSKDLWSIVAGYAISWTDV